MHFFTSHSDGGGRMRGPFALLHADPVQVAIVPPHHASLHVQRSSGRRRADTIESNLWKLKVTFRCLCHHPLPYLQYGFEFPTRFGDLFR